MCCYLSVLCTNSVTLGKKLKFQNSQPNKLTLVLRKINDLYYNKDKDLLNTYRKFSYILKFNFFIYENVINVVIFGSTNTLNFLSIDSSDFYSELSLLKS